MVEPISLTEDILDKKGDFVNTFFEFITKEGLNINVRADVTSVTTVTLYTVPNKKVFYLIGSALTSFCDGTGIAGTTGGSFVSTNQHSTLLTIRHDRGVQSNDALSQTYPYGLKFEEGEAITLGTGVDNTECFGSIQGIEVNKDIAVRR